MGDYIMRIDGQTVKGASINGSDIKEIRNATTQTVLWRKPAPNYFYFEDRSGAANSISLTKTGVQDEWLSLEYSTDKETWTSWDFSQNIPLAANGKVYLRGNNAKFSVSSGNYHYFGSTGNVYAGGSVRSLFNKSVPQTRDSSATMFGWMFFGMTTLVGIDTNLFAGINYGSSGSWRDTTNMFYRTFSGCSSLVTPPDLSGIGYARDNTFRETFNQCTSLTTTAPLNIIETMPNAKNTFKSMYYQCYALVDASPMRVSCNDNNEQLLYQIFTGCNHLVTPPDLTGVTVLGKQAIGNGFRACDSLQFLKVGFTEWDDETDPSTSNYASTHAWTYNINTNGVFIAPSALPKTRNSADNTTKSSFIPYNWSIADLNGKLYAPVITNNNGTITIAEAEGGASCQIFYTVDGTTPTPTNGTLYTQPFTVGSGVTVKAITHYNGVRADLITDSDVAWAGSISEPTLTSHGAGAGHGSETTCSGLPYHNWTIRMKTTGVEGVTYYLNWTNANNATTFPADPTTTTYDATATYSGQIGCVEADSECRYTVTLCDADMVGVYANFKVIGVRNGYVSSVSTLSIENPNPIE